jgi:Zn-dependent protease with chaperone function/Tfp pilus assembly protein PilE
VPFDPRYRSPRERPLFVAGVVFSALAWLAVIVSVVGLVYAALGALFFLAAHALFLAHVRTNGVRVDARQLPDLQARVAAAAASLGLAQVPAVYVLQGGGLLNAFATKLLSRRYVILLSDLVDHCADPRQLDFVIGHELGHLAAGHLTWNLFLMPYRILPWLGAAYWRACEYTCDRCGLVAAGDAEQAMRGLVVLAAGGRIAAQVDLAAFASQRLESGGFWSTVLELTSYHPFLCKRVGQIQEVGRPGTLQPVRRSLAGAILAPVLGSVAGGAGAAPLMAIAMVGVLAAIAIPNYVRYQLRAKEAAGKAELAGLYKAELAQLDTGGRFRELRVPAQKPGRVAATWSADDLAVARKLDWVVTGTSHYAYTVAVGRTKDGRQAFAACAEADLDGDGAYSALVTWHPVDVGGGELAAPPAPCRFGPKLTRSLSFQQDDTPGVPTKVTAETVF